MSNSSIDAEKLRAAKEKLACHIEPPKGSAYARALAESKAAAIVPDDPAGTEDESCGSCQAPEVGSNKTGDRIRLTEMTSAGG